MHLNTIKPAVGSKTSRKRLGRGTGSGLGKTCGKGHKGQTARSGGYHRVGFEGGQMPMQRRLPKFGFNSRTAFEMQEIRLSQIIALDLSEIDFHVLKEAGLVKFNVTRAKVIKDSRATEVPRAIVLRGLAVTAGVKTAIEAAKGRIEE